MRDFGIYISLITGKEIIQDNNFAPRADYPPNNIGTYKTGTASHQNRFSGKININHYALPYFRNFNAR